MQTTDNIVIAFVPGTSASELNTNAVPNTPSRRAWPEALAPQHVEFYTSNPLCQAIINEKEMPVGDLVDDFNMLLKTLKCYASLVQYMQTQMGFTSAIPSSCKPLHSGTKPLTAPLPKVFYHCPYDWRQTNQDSARKLGDALVELDSVYTKNNQTYKLYIVGHSMGGLVSRGLLEDPASKTAPWFAKTQALITLATPHYGAPLALSAILGQKIADIEIGRYIKFIQAVIDQPAFPSTYELLPPPGQAFIQDSSGNALDIYSAAPDSSFMKALAALGFSATSLNEAEAFFSTLTVTQPDTTPVPYHCFVGTAHETFANNTSSHQLAFTYQAGSADPFVVSPKVMTGDGVVPVDSARFVFQLTDPRCKTFPYTHGQMGGSDMDNYPEAIQAMLKLIGLPIPQAEPQVTPQAEPSPS